MHGTFKLERLRARGQWAPVLEQVDSGLPGVSVVETEGKLVVHCLRAKCDSDLFPFLEGQFCSKKCL